MCFVFLQCRRSQRNIGQRKRYIDDVNLSLSDEETLEDIMQPPPKRSSFYSQVQEDEESDYEDLGVPSRQKTSKYKNTITVNSTEGFRYSDIYLASCLWGLATLLSPLPPLSPPPPTSGTLNLLLFLCSPGCSS